MNKRHFKWLLVFALLLGTMCVVLQQSLSSDTVDVQQVMDDYLNSRFGWFNHADARRQLLRVLAENEGRTLPLLLKHVAEKGTDESCIDLAKKLDFDRLYQHFKNSDWKENTSVIELVFAAMSYKNVPFSQYGQFALSGIEGLPSERMREVAVHALCRMTLENDLEKTKVLEAAIPMSSDWGKARILYELSHLQKSIESHSNLLSELKKSSDDRIKALVQEIKLVPSASK